MKHLKQSSVGFIKGYRFKTSLKCVWKFRFCVSVFFYICEG